MSEEATPTNTPSAAALDWITRLIRIDTTSRDSNLPLIEVVAAEIRTHGVEPVLVPNDEGTKASLVATFPAADGTTQGGIVLSGHTDVVPVDGQDWSSEPFAPEVRDDRLYGRGSCDMKSFVGVVVSRIPAILAQPLREPIHLAFSYDEEVGCTGAVDLVKDMVGRGLRPRGCIVGEPSSMRVIHGHKSINLVRVDFHGVAAHSSLTPKGVNAIEYAAQLARYVRTVADEFREHGPYDEAFDVPYTTCTVNLIEGGIAVNTVPADCTLQFEFRSIGAVDPVALIERFRAEADRIEAAMRAENPAAHVEFTVVAQAPGLDTPIDAEVVELASSWGGALTSDKVAYGTEAGLFDQGGIPTVVCGPGDINQAHSPDEFIPLEQIARCERFVDAVIAGARATSD
ncbi:MAG: acetylornithine deacetylase [Intrasporangium sp.]|uniref:acetylornithine deacetylase n=1 Tax=Intrasporangium sp. TaxID=1925024 RepID=UPI002648AF7E|nr:acetylornithine deacetylase [Intrasporangium sp.]MDN5797523.1 acetylornithine deacetylase [Intrasporangium sp.]